MFVALDQAIRARLMGYPLNKSGQPATPSVSPGVRIPAYTPKTNDMRTEGFQPFQVIPNVWTQIPIFKAEVIGVDNERVYPSVTYDFVGMQPRFDQWLPPLNSNSIIQPAQGDLVTVTNRQGEIIGEGYRQNAYNPIPESYDVMVQFDIYSKIQYQAYLILHAFLLLFPQKGCISVPQANGTSHDCDMLMQETVKISQDTEADVQETGGSQAEYREHRFTVTYNVEAYLDTTWPSMTVTVPTVQEVDLEMTSTTTTDATNLATDDGVLETIQITQT